MNEARTKALFQDALDLAPADRDAFLARECAGDSGLRARVDRLLAAHDDADDFLEHSATWMAGVDLSPDGPAETVGDTIGGFELLAQLGEGGFGTVWRARQDVPVRREVALKVIKLGMDTAEVVRRFEREREALERLDHPNVAKILDAGATGDGRPWFAMELVEGLPITDFCDRQQLDVRARLELFVTVCRAIQHAHHNGIVHRDIKPSNVLVTARDGEPVPRIIDFGIAKAIHQDEAELTMFTQERRLLGTPEYMSPEQVESWGADVDARTDVYSLGVLLHELLIGSRPFDARREGAFVHAVILQRIREEEPIRPSARLAAADETEQRSVAELRSDSPASLRRALQGELDWIVLRALEKSRERRYATPAELAGDVDRYLRDEVVTAGPPSAAYRFRKFARRHRVFLTATAVVMIALLAGSGFAIYGLVQARKSADAERDAREVAQAREAQARREADKARLALTTLEELLTAADPRWRRGPDYTVREMLDEFDANLAMRSLDDPEVEARVRTVLGRTYRQLGELERASEHLDTALALRQELFGEDHPAVAESRMDQAWVLQDRARYEEALAAVEPALEFWRTRSDGGDQLAAALDARANLFAQTGRFEAARRDLEEALSLSRGSDSVSAANAARLRSRLAQILFMTGRVAEAAPVMQEALDGLSTWVAEGHPEVLTLRHNLAVMLDQLGRHAEAEPLHGAVLEDRIALHGEDHPSVASSRMNLGWVRFHLGRYESAEHELRLAREGLADSLGADHPFVTESINRLGVVLQRLGRLDEAEELLKEALDRCRRLEGHRVDSLVTTWTNLALLLVERGRAAEAERELEAALAVARVELPDPHPVTVAVLLALADLVTERGDRAAAERFVGEAVQDGRTLWGEDHPMLREQERRLDSLKKAREASFGR